MKVRILVACSLAAASVLAVPATAMAGEVKGPSTFVSPGVGVQNFDYTGALDHANSICAASGLNDMDRTQEPGGPAPQVDSRVQTAADMFKYYGGTPQMIGDACRGGSGE